MNPSTLIAPSAWQQIKYFTQTRRVVRHVQRNFSRPIALGEAAAIAKMERTSFSKFFKKATGLGFAEFVRRYRLQVAVNRMSRPNASIHDVAFECGYACVETLERALKMYLGIEPDHVRPAAIDRRLTEARIFEFPAAVGGR